MATLTSLNVGLPTDVEWHGRTVHTGIWKRPVAGSRIVGRLNIEGDGQGDLAGHGGEQRAVLVYQLDSYRHWQDHFGRDLLEPGSFGENLTVDGLPDDEVCIGDRYRIGNAEFEVTQPRVTCFRVGMRLGKPDLPKLLVAHRRPGFYCRVIAEGRIRAGDEIELLARGRHAITVAEIDGLLYLPDPDLERIRLAADIPALSPGWRQSFEELLQAAEQGGPVVSATDAGGPGWPGFRPLTVSRIVAETSDVRSIHLAAPDGAPLPRPRPGQFVTIRLPDTVQPTTLRSYSLSSAPDDPAYRISVKRDGRGLASRWLHEHLTVGTTLEVAAPRGDFTLDGSGSSGSDPIVLVSAGIGVTPVLAMLHDLAAHRSTRPVWWLHSTRDAGQRVFAAEIAELLTRLPNARVRYFSTAASAVAPAAPDTVAGRMSGRALTDLGIPASASVYLCGPEGFLAAMRVVFLELGIDAGHISSELFGTVAPINPGIVGEHAVPPHPPAGPIGTGPPVTFVRSGLAVRWSAGRDASLLGLAESCDIPTRWSCRSGVCHTCVTSVLAGSYRYTSEPLQDPGPDQVLLCCAEPTSELVIDL
jgi:ferredoxin-NADP reductase/MOSC domain-containing protein YiiM/ferredoxin